jgi:hypothetical protein
MGRLLALAVLMTSAITTDSHPSAATMGACAGGRHPGPQFAEISWSRGVERGGRAGTPEVAGGASESLPQRPLASMIDALRCRGGSSSLEDGAVQDWGDLATSQARDGATRRRAAPAGRRSEGSQGGAATGPGGMHAIGSRKMRTPGSVHFKRPSPEHQHQHHHHQRQNDHHKHNHQQQQQQQQGHKKGQLSASIDSSFDESSEMERAAMRELASCAVDAPFGGAACFCEPSTRLSTAEDRHGLPAPPLSSLHILLRLAHTSASPQCIKQSQHVMHSPEFPLAALDDVR